MPWNKVMSKFSEGNLHSGGPGGPTVKNRKQAIAIMLAEKRKASGKPEYRARQAFEDGGVTPDDTTDDGTVVRAMYYGSDFGEHNRDANYGPADNKLQPYDVAISPATAKQLGVGIGDWVEAYGKPYRVADWSYLHPGQPTSNTVEFRDHPADGHVRIRPLPADQIPQGVEDLQRIAAPNVDTSRGPMPGLGGDAYSAPEIADPFSRMLDTTLSEAPQMAQSEGLTGEAVNYAAQDVADQQDAQDQYDPEDYSPHSPDMAGVSQIDWRNAKPVARSKDGQHVKMSNGMWVDIKNGAVQYSVGGHNYVIPPGANKAVEQKANKPLIKTDPSTNRLVDVTDPKNPKEISMPGEEPLPPGATIDQVPEQDRADTKAMLEGRYPVPQGGRMTGRSAYLLKLANQIDPKFTYYTARVRNKVQDDFNSGKESYNRKSLNTAIDHLGKLKVAADALDNTRFDTVNAFKNWYNSRKGESAVNAYDAAGTALANELASAFKSGVGGTIPEIEQWRKSLSHNMSPKQQRDVINMAIGLMAGRIAAMRGKFEAVGLPPDSVSLIDPGNRKLLKSINSPYANALLADEPDESDNSKAQTTPKSSPTSIPSGGRILRDPNTGQIQRQNADGSWQTLPN